jgi:hypothetical protein
MPKCICFHYLRTKRAACNRSAASPCVILMVILGHIFDYLLIGLLAAMTIAYLILGPLVFIAPLLPFRGSMQEVESL